MIHAKDVPIPTAPIPTPRPLDAKVVQRVYQTIDANQKETLVMIATPAMIVTRTFAKKTDAKDVSIHTALAPIPRPLGAKVVQHAQI